MSLAPSPGMPAGGNVVPRLSVMMFLQFFIWGCWYVSVGNFIGAMGKEHGAEGWSDSLVGWAYTVGPIAAVISPLFLGVVADRFFPSQRALGVMHLLGGGLMFLLNTLVGADDHELFSWVLLGYMLCYMPTLGLSNTVAFHNLNDQEKQFPVVRVFGTIGWIAGNETISTWMGADYDARQFLFAGGASILLGLYSFTLPNVAPPSRGQKADPIDLLGLRAAMLLKDWRFLVFMLASMLICIPLAAYYSWAQVFVGDLGEARPASVMAWGQYAEIGFMFLMPLAFARLGVKWMLAAGMAAWVVRYLLFAGAADGDARWMMLGGILLHGICYDFFFVTGQIFVDKAAPRAIRGQAQGFLVLMTQGIGLGIGAQLATQLKVDMTYVTTDGGNAVQWDQYWVYPAGFAAGVLVLFWLLFRGREPQPA